MNLQDGGEKNKEMAGFWSPTSDTDQTMGTVSVLDVPAELEGKIASIDTLKELLRHWGCGNRTAGPRVLQDESAAPDPALVLLLGCT